MHFLLELAHFDVDDFARPSCGMDDRWDGKRIDIRSKFDSAANLGRRRHSLLNRRQGFTESETCGGSEATLEKTTSAQHRIQARLDEIFARREFIRCSIC